MQAHAVAPSRLARLAGACMHPLRAQLQPQGCAAASPSHLSRVQVLLPPAVSWRNQRSTGELTAAAGAPLQPHVAQAASLVHSTGVEGGALLQPKRQAALSVALAVGGRGVLVASSCSALSSSSALPIFAPLRRAAEIALACRSGPPRLCVDVHSCFLPCAAPAVGHRRFNWPTRR